MISASFGRSGCLIWSDERRIFIDGFPRLSGPNATSLALTRSSPGSARSVSISLRRSVVEKALQVRATLDYGSRPLLELASYAFKERSSNLHVQTLSQRNFVCSVP